MSYDLHLFQVPPGRTARDVYESGELGDKHRTKVADPEKEARKRRIMDALLQHDPRLVPFEFDHTQIAKTDGIAVEEARRRYRHIELNDDETNSPIQITLFDDEVSVTIAYWHQGPQAAQTLRKVGGYLNIIVAHSGYTAYDPQLGKVIDPDRDYQDCLNAYGAGVAAIERVSQTGNLRKPWWKFW